MPDGLAVRVCLPEWMDQPGLDPRLHHEALRGLARVNVVSRTLDAVWAPIAQIARGAPGRQLTVLDVACGGGDLAVGLSRRAARQGVALEVRACDISDTALAHARERAGRRGSGVEFFRHDVLAGDVPPHDVITCSLFLHHLDSADAVTVLRRLHAAARRLVVVSDLDRSRLGLGLAWAGTRVLSRSPVVHVDALRSVRAAFTLAEARALAEAAGLPHARVTRHWPRRWRLVAEAS